VRDDPVQRVVAPRRPARLPPVAVANEPARDRAEDGQAIAFEDLDRADRAHAVRQRARRRNVPLADVGRGHEHPKAAARTGRRHGAIMLRDG
jgi:hypothetical protein